MMHRVLGLIFLLSFFFFPNVADSQTNEETSALPYEIEGGKMKLAPVEISTGTFLGEILQINNQRVPVKVRYLENEEGDCPTPEVCHTSIPKANCWITAEDCGCLCSLQSEERKEVEFTDYGTGDLEKVQ